MATQTLSMPNNAPAQVLSSTTTTGHCDPLSAPFLSPPSSSASPAATKSNGRTIKSDERNASVPPSTSVIHGQGKHVELVRRRQSSLDRVVLRKHKYENLTMLLNTPQALALLRSKSPREMNAADKTGESHTAVQPVVVSTTMAVLNTNTVTVTAANSAKPAPCEVVRPELPKLCLSPRFPPDGAAFYESSPPHSSVSTSPVASLQPDLKSNVGASPTAIVTAHGSWVAESEWRTQRTNGSSATVSPPKTVAVSLGSTNGSFSADRSTRSGEQALNEAPHSVVQSSIPSPESNGLPNHLVPGAGTRDQSDWFPPAPPPPLQASRTSNTVDKESSGPHYHEHCRPGEEILRGFDANRSNGGHNSSGRTVDCVRSMPSTCTPSSTTLDQNPALFHPDRALSSPTPPPLPPPPPPPSPPAVPRRDPKTALHQPQGKQFNNSDSHAQLTPPNRNEAGPSRQNQANSTSINPKQIDSSNRANTTTTTTTTTTVETPLSAQLTNGNHRAVNDSELTDVESINHAPSKGSSGTRVVTQSATAKPVTRPIPLKSDPTTNGPVDYHRHHSLPACTETATEILDGRSVVPWKPTSRDLIPTTGSDPSVQAAVAAALSQSGGYSDDTPQWVPPKNVNPAHNVLAPTPDYVGTIPPTTSAACEPEGDESGASEVQTTPRRTVAARPTCLTTTTGADPRLTERIRQSGKRYMSESSSSGRRDAGRRNRTTSDMDVLHRLVEIGYPGMGPQAMDGSRSSGVGMGNLHPMSPTEAEWWRAQQRSGLIPYGSSRTKEPPDLFQRQVSAGPTFNLTPTQLSPTRLPTSQHAMARSREFAHLVGRTKSSPSEHARALMTQSSIRSQFNEAVVLDDPDTAALFDSPHLGYPHPMVPISPEHARYWADSRFASSDQPHRASLDRGHANRLHESFEFDPRDRMAPETGTTYPSSMTQSVFFPPDAAWIASGHPYDGAQPTSTPNTAVSVSGRRRRVRTGVMRSHSQRVGELFDPRFMGSDTVPEAPGFALSPTFYQRSISHTVPLEAMRPDMAWPPVLAQWHHRRPINEEPSSQRSDSGAVRKERSLRAGRSSNDLIHVNRTKHAHPQHHHSASAIYERLEEQLWFHFDLSRAGAERLLKSAPVGSFLVRQSETSKSEYSLSVRRECDFLHMKISQDPTSNQYVLGEYSQPYPTVSAMIFRYMQSLLPVRGTTPVLLRFPVYRKSPKKTHHGME